MEDLKRLRVLKQKVAVAEKKRDNCEDIEENLFNEKILKDFSLSYFFLSGVESVFFP